MTAPGFTDRDIAKISVDTRVAIAACDAEMKAARALGAGWFDAYANGYRVLDEILDIARDPERELILTRFHMIGC